MRQIFNCRQPGTILLDIFVHCPMFCNAFDIVNIVYSDQLLRRFSSPVFQVAASLKTKIVSISISRGGQLLPVFLQAWWKEEDNCLSLSGMFILRSGAHGSPVICGHHRPCFVLQNRVHAFQILCKIRSRQTVGKLASSN